MVDVTYEEAIERIPKREIPPYWMGAYAELENFLRDWGEVHTIALSPGGRPVHVITIGKQESCPRRANYNSAWAARLPAAFVDRENREKPVVMLVGPAHGHEVEGLTGLVNLLQIMKTGRDLRGKQQRELQELGAQCRLVIVPVLNPDGLARFVPRSLHNMTRIDMQFWGQGTWRDDSLCGWPGCKSQHPMVGSNVGFLGCYFNDIGVNPMHEEFFDCLSTEVPALLALARREAPDYILCLHSFALRPEILRPAFVPRRVQAEALAIAQKCYGEIGRLGLRHAAPFSLDRPDEQDVFNLVSALHHTSGACVLLFECPHGLRDEDSYAADFDDLLDIQLAVYRGLLVHAVEQKPKQRDAGS